MRGLERLASGAFLRSSRFDDWLSRHRHVAEGLDNPILRSSLPARSLALLERWERLLASPDQERERLNAAFVESELRRFKTYFDQVERNPVTDMQRRACVVANPGGTWQTPR